MSTAVSYTGRRKWKDITGQVYGQLTVVERAGNDRWQQVMWKCRCTCGREVIARGGALREGRVQRCRQCAYDRQRKHPPLRAGDHYGSLLLLGRIQSSKMWRVQCTDCKRKFKISQQTLHSSGKDTRCRYCRSRYTFYKGQIVGPYRVRKTVADVRSRCHYDVVCTRCGARRKILASTLRRWARQGDVAQDTGCGFCRGPRRRYPPPRAGDHVGVYMVLDALPNSGHYKVMCIRCKAVRVLSRSSLYQHKRLNCKACRSCRSKQRSKP